jgi:hypothetical protein
MLNIREQEVSSRVPLKAELFGNIKEGSEDLPSEVTCPAKKANLSVAELLEDLQGRSSSSVGTVLVCFLWYCFIIGVPR